jgi:hypothetical protein
VRPGGGGAGRGHPGRGERGGPGPGRAGFGHPGERAGLRGAVPIVLASPIVAGVPGTDRLLDIVFVTVVVCTLVQGPSLPALARVLGLAAPDRAHELQVDAVPWTASTPRC